MKYHVKFIGRPNGALGIRWEQFQFVEAESRDGARRKVYERFEHVEFVSVEEYPFPEPK